jgi:type 1 glutamine amidotransferase
MRFALACLFASALCAQSPIRVLIVDGVNNHDWRAGTRGILDVLGESGRFQATVSTTPPDLAGWRPRFADYQAVIVNWNGGHTAKGVRWPAAIERELEEYVRGGGGLVAFHAANNAFLEWPAWNQMIGLLWRPKEFGPSLVISDGGKVVRIPAGQGLNPGHGPRHDFEIVVLDPAHPITSGLPPRFAHVSEQLTHGQHGPAEGLTILTYAWSKDARENEPMDWVRTWGKGRVYVTMLGHTWRNEENPNLRSAGFRQLLARGVEWAATGTVRGGAEGRQ